MGGHNLCPPSKNMTLHADAIGELCMSAGDREILFQHSDAEPFDLGGIVLPISYGGVVIGRDNGEIKFIAHIEGGIFEFMNSIANMEYIFSCFLEGKKIRLGLLRMARTCNCRFYFEGDYYMWAYKVNDIEVYLSKRLTACLNVYSDIKGLSKLDIDIISKLDFMSIFNKFDCWGFELDGVDIGGANTINENNTGIFIGDMKRSFTLEFFKSIENRKYFFNYSSKQLIYISKSVTLHGDCAMRLLKLNSDGTAVFETEEGDVI